MIEIREGALLLQLESERWVKWDEHAAYQRGVQRLAGTKAVDVCATVAGEGAVFLELKDFRAAASQNAPRIRSGALAREVAEKVRDTLAGLVWACGRGLGEPSHERLTRDFLARPKAYVVLWLETDGVDAAGAAVLQSAIQKELKPHLEAKVTVTSTLLEKHTGHPLRWLRASGLPSPRLARRPRRAPPKPRKKP